MFQKLKEDKYFSRILAVIITIGHIVAIASFGATFWVDSILYLNMSYYLTPGVGISGFYSPIIKCIASHFPLFPALLWSWLYVIFGKFTWVSFAFVQHLLAGLSLFYLVMALKKHFNKVSLLIATEVLMCYPFYQSFHNMVMTESLASTFLITLAASTLYILFDKKKIKLHMTLFTLAAFIGIQSRPQILLFALSFLFIQLITLRRELLKIIVMAIIIIIGYFVFPFARGLATGHYFLPNIGCLGVRTALTAYVNQGSEAANILSKYDLPPNLDPIKALAEGLTYEQSLAWKDYLVNKGSSATEADKYLTNIASRIRFSSMPGIESQLDSALAGIGILNFSVFHKENDVISEGMTRTFWTNHYTNHYKWLSWVTEANHTDIFNDFIQRFIVSGWYHPKSIQIMQDTMKPFISKSTSGRDPIRLSIIPTDFWTIGWLVGMILLYLSKRKKLMIVLSVPPVINYFVVLFVGFGNIRYFYVAAPFELLTTILVLFYTVIWIKKKITKLR